MVWVVSLSTTEVSPRRLTPPAGLVALVVCVNAVTSAWPLAHAARYLHQPPVSGGLHLNAFRGEPAISTFGWHFTPIHSSSPSFATLVGASLDAVSPALHSGHG
jgi:hypothetical protein